MKEAALVRWRRRAIAAKQLAERFQTPFAKRGMMQVVATYKWLAKHAVKRKRAWALPTAPPVVTACGTASVANPSPNSVAGTSGVIEIISPGIS
jgi:hypothetical protein